MHKTVLGLVALTWTAGCGSSAAEEAQALPGAAEKADRQVMRLEAWSRYDDPARIEGLEYKMAALPTEGAVAVIPWADGYHPAALDSINHAWAGPESEPPTRKYERAFGVAGLAQFVSRKHGIGTSTGALCESDRHCGHGVVCGKRQGQTQGRCTPAWWGLNHGWAAAATLHPEPRHAVTHHGVTFEVQDIKALLALVYNTAETQQVALRSQEPPRSVALDDVGRPTCASTRDTNPGTYHLLVTNLIGKRQQSFIEDGDIARDVDNRPLSGYEVLQQHEVGASEAARMLGRDPEAGYPYNAAAVRWAYVKLETRYTKSAVTPLGYVGDRVDQHTYTSNYEYILELDGAGNVIGGEWVGHSKRNHPDFVWLAYGPSKSMTADEKARADNIFDLARRSVL